MKIKHIVQILALIAAILFFVPTMCVSCSGIDIRVSGAKIMTGISLYGEKISDPVPIVILSLLLPLGAAAVWFIKKGGRERLIAILSAVMALIDFILWIVVRTRVKAVAVENYCTCKVNAGYVILLIILILLMAANVMIMLGAVSAESSLTGAGGTDPGGTPQGKPPDPGDQQNRIFCPNCGAALAPGSKFCGKCGAGPFYGRGS